MNTGKYRMYEGVVIGGLAGVVYGLLSWAFGVGESDTSVIGGLQGQGKLVGVVVATIAGAFLGDLALRTNESLSRMKRGVGFGIRLGAVGGAGAGLVYNTVFWLGLVGIGDGTIFGAIIGLIVGTIAGGFYGTDSPKG